MAKVKLTDTRIKNESLVNGKAKQIYDEDVTNLYIRISKTKKVFYYRYNFNGKYNQIKLGEYPYLSLKEARSEAINIYKKILSDEDPKVKKKVEKTYSFKELMKKYREDHISNLREKTISAYDSIIANQLDDLNSMNIKDIEILHISENLSKRKKETVYGALMQRGFLSGFFKWCKSMGHIETNPVTDAIEIKKPEPRQRFYDKKEIRKIYKALPETPQPLSDIIQFLFVTGKRKGETTLLKYDMIDWEKRILTIPSNVTKNKSEDKVHLCDSALNLIWYRQHNY